MAGPRNFKRVVFAATAAAFAVCAMASEGLAASPKSDFSKLDPAWAAQQLDESLRSGDMGSAWAALRTVFPAEYKQLTQDMATAVIQHQDWRGRSQTFIQNHVAGQVQTAQRAPAIQQARYQRRKAEFLTYLSRTNVNACAYLGTGIGDPSVLGNLSSEEMKRYSDLIAATVETIGAGRDSPVTYSDITADDVSQIKAIMANQGISDAGARGILSGQVGKSPAELCSAGVIRNNALAAAPADVVAKVAFR
jgi:hypothetical protein